MTTEIDGYLAKSTPETVVEPWQPRWNRHRPAYITEVDGGVIACCDALDLLRGIEKESADIVFLDPPFNLGKKYGGMRTSDDLHEVSSYLTYMQRVLRRSADVLKPGGSLFLYHLPSWAFQ